MKRHNFTIIELLVVIVIIAILAGITVGGISFASSKADEAKTIAMMEEFQTALEEYKKDYSIYPIFDGEINFSDSSWDKFTNKNGDNKKHRPYMEGIDSTQTEYLDGFDYKFRYQFPNTEPSRNTKKYAFWSIGEDGINNTKDDICSWKQK